MRIKRILFLMLLPIAMEVLIACCDCEDLVIKHYTNKNIEVYNIDNSGKSPDILISSSISKNSYGIRIQPVNEIVAGRHPENGGLFINSSYAICCYCGPSLEIIPNDSITSLRIISLHNFNETHPAGSDVSKYFKVYSPYAFSSIDRYVDSISWTFNFEQQLNMGINFLMMTPPTVEGQHKFKVEVVLSDDRVFVKETPGITLL